MTGLATPGDLTPPLTPNAQNARELLLQELSKPGYQTGKSDLIARLEKALSDWLSSIRIGNGGGTGIPALGYAVIVAVVIVALVVAFLVFGLPRLNRRREPRGGLFGDDDLRDSDALRAAAAAAAANGDYTTAIEESFRASARGLAEREIVTMFPGTTASGFATAAAHSFPELALALASAATAFDGVRYLGRAGTEAQWLASERLEKDLRASRAVAA